MHGAGRFRGLLPMDMERKLNKYQAFRRCPGRPLNVMYIQFTSCVQGVVIFF